MISVVIMAHRKRARWVPELEERLECPVVWDRHNDRHETGLRAIRAYDPKASHHLIVQDDALLPRGFLSAIRAVAEKVGERPVGLYTGRSGPQHRVIREMAQRGEPRFIAGKGPHWGVAVLLPTVHCDGLSEWYEAQNSPNYDRRIAEWYERQNIDCWYTAPSLVEHRWEDNPSLVPGRNGTRRAAWFAGIDVDVSGFVWPDHPVEWPNPTKLVTFVGPGGRTRNVRVESTRYRRYSDHPQWVELGSG